MGSVVTAVTVEPDRAGGLSVRWELAGDDCAVAVAVGPTPELVEHEHAVTVPTAQRVVRLADVGPGRHYVSVSPRDGGAAMVAAERRLPFEGVYNFRDLGGYRTADGRTRWGQVFRADSLHGFSPSDHGLFARLGLRVIYDLRTDDERQQSPNALQNAEELRSIWLPLFASSQLDTVSVTERLRDGERFLLELYLGMLSNSAQVFGELLGGLSDPDGLPAVFHCAGGKDRTGMTAAILLSVLGVADDDILDDYELTSGHRTEDRRQEIMATMEKRGVAPETAAGLLSTPRWVMATVLEEIRTTYGRVEDYLVGPAGMTSDAIIALRGSLVAKTSR